MRSSHKVDQRPAFLFYPDAWFTDTGNRSSSLAARGLWADILCLAYISPERGVLKKQNGSKVETRDLAKICGAPESEIEALLKELDANGVYSIRDDGAIYCRRMVRDERIRQARAAAGSMGGRPSKSKAKHEAKQTPPVPVPSPVPSPDNKQPSFAPSGAIQDFALAWNGLGEPFPRVLRFGRARSAKLSTRLRDSWWRENYPKALALMHQRPFLAGKGDGGWIADVDWFMREDSVTKILEGKAYMGGNHANGTGASRGNPQSGRTFAAASEQAGKFAGT